MKNYQVQRIVIDPSDDGNTFELFDIIEKFEMKGYRVHTCTCARQQSERENAVMILIFEKN